ncbi:MAG: hypothetical protein GC159_02675 [Phycisphaera sp.]|nr:hypothetical protein [Phycisphaera sp.]
MSLCDLTDHIIGAHHTYLRREFGRLVELCELARRDAPHAANLVAVAAILRRIGSDLVKHLDSEEQVLFPLIRSLDYATRQQGCYPGGVEHWLSEMCHDHDTVNAELAELRRVTHAFAVPAGSADSYTKLMQALAELDQNLAQHTAKEDALFARAIDAETILRRGAGAPGNAQPNTSSPIRENAR